MRHVFIVAEIGCNHNGSRKLAEQLVYAAAKCRVDAVKFQTFNASALISKIAPKADYQKKTTGTSESQLEMTKRLELPREDYLYLSKLAESLGLTAFSTPFDMGSIDFLEQTKQRIWKIPSGEITNLPYLEKIGGMACPDKVIALSTGMSTIDEISNAVSILNKSQKNRIIILHCNTEYPTPDCDVNVCAMDDLRKHFPNYEIGFSDHSRGFIAATMAVGLGATYLEKHFTLDRSLPGPDQMASSTPDEMAELVKYVRQAEILSGNGLKHVTDSEAKNKIIARKSIVALTSIKKGDVFSVQNITCKRPGNGISPMHWYEVLGQKATRDFPEDSLIEVPGLPMEGLK